LNKTVVSQICIAVIALCLLFTDADGLLLRGCVGILATLGGVDFIRRRNGSNQP